MNMPGESIIKSILEENVDTGLDCHTDGPAYNDSSGDDSFENWQNN